jgi:aldose 1-epimerase
MTNTGETENICGLKSSDFQATINGKKTDLYILKNNQGNEVAFTNYGGALVAIMVPDKNGNRANVIQGHDNIQDVMNSPEPYLSTLIGRYGNRIAKGKFQLHGKEYNLAINNGPNSLHGGKVGFNAKVWDVNTISPNAAVLKYTSAYGEEGFSGEVTVWVAYTFTDDNELIIKYLATTNKKTIINLTSHGFFSLAGIANPTPTIENLVCQINADYYIPIDETSIPTGEIRFVKGTPFDFRTPKTVGQDIDADDEQIKHGAGYDHCFVLNKKEEDAN